MLNTKSFNLIGSLLTLAAFSAVGHAGGYTTSIAVGTMTNFTPINAAVVDSTTYTFDAAQAASLYSNVSVSGPTVQCNAVIPGDCTPGDNPGTPSTPPSPSLPDAEAYVSSIECIYLDGGSLPSATYQQTISEKGLLGTSTYVYTYTYGLTPNQASVAPLTDWTVTSTGTGSTAQVVIQASLASEEVIKSGRYTDFAFVAGLFNGQSLFTNLSLSVDGSKVASPSVTIERGQDFSYTTNSGSYGNVSLLRNGDAETILNSDSTRFNDNGGSGGYLMEMAVTKPVTVNLAPGNHSVSLSGKFLMASVNQSMPFTVGQDITVVAPGCSSP